MSKVIGALDDSSRTSFGAALSAGWSSPSSAWIAIAAGWVEASDSNGSEAPTLAASPLPAARRHRRASGKGLTVNQIYQQDSPGVAFIQAQQAPQSSSPFNPFGGGGGGTATGSGFVIDHAGHILTNAHVVDGAQQDRGHARQHRQLAAGERSGGGQGPLDRRRAAQGRRAVGPAPPALARGLLRASRSAIRWSRSATRSGSTAP